MSKIKIQKGDEHRVLLTEMLPYETPMLFSNEGFYTILKSKNGNSFFSRLLQLKAIKRFGIPFNYEVKKEEGDSRVLSVIHPLHQLPFIEFYKKYDSIILHQCSKSPFSLRKIHRVAKFCYSPDLVFQEDEVKNAELEVEPDVLDRETRLLKSYFTYHPVDIIHKFYDGMEYVRLEQKFNYLLEFDLSKCFYNIYTHSVTWAVKGKEVAKRNKSFESFENSFDQLMQQANYNETNGIVVGPEVSRVFAEIILQQIDLNALAKLENQPYNFKYGVDFEVKRYVDDYFVFSNDDKCLNSVLEVFKNELNAYKLYINKAKTQKRKTPFISNLAVAKREIQNICSCLNDELTVDIIAEGKKNRQLRVVRNPAVFLQNFIKDFQCIVKRNQLGYEHLSKEVIRNLKAILIETIKEEKEGNVYGKSEMEVFLLIVIDISFYCYILNVTASTTFKIAQVIVLVEKYLGKRTEPDLRHVVFSKISREADRAMSIFQRKSKQSDTNIEVLNLLIALRKLGEDYLLSEKKMFDLFKIRNETDFQSLNYFQIISLLYYIQDDGQYSSFKSGIESAVIEKFALEADPFSKAELAMLFFDFICCPFVSPRSKSLLMSKTRWATGKVKDEILAIENQKHWFMCWDADIDLESILKKKEWSSSY